MSIIPKPSRCYGLVKDVYDKTDRKHIYKRREIPKYDGHHDLSEYVSEVYDQGPLESCSANAVCAAYLIDLRKESEDELEEESKEESEDELEEESKEESEDKLEEESKEESEDELEGESEDEMEEESEDELEEESKEESEDEMEEESEDELEGESKEESEDELEEESEDEAKEESEDELEEESEDEAKEESEDELEEESEDEMEEESEDESDVSEMEYPESESSFMPSRLFLYYNARSDKKHDTGASLRDTIKAFHKFGVCSEEDWSYDPSKLEKKPLPECFQTATKADIEYKRLRRNLDQFRACISDSCPFVFGMKVFSSFESQGVEEKGNLRMPSTDERRRGHIDSHAVVAVAYDDHNREFKCLNSWGEDGEIMVTSTCLMISSWAKECCVLTFGRSHFLPYNCMYYIFLIYMIVMYNCCRLRV